MSVFFMDFDMAPSVIWARDLYDQMQIRSDFRKWFPRMCQYGFVEGRDYEFVPRVRPQDEGGRTVQRGACMAWGCGFVAGSSGAGRGHRRQARASPPREERGLQADLLLSEQRRFSLKVQGRFPALGGDQGFLHQGGFFLDVF